MKPITGFFTVITFFLWIQPLGAFIAPSMEDAACGGNRAFHMCSTQFAAKIASVSGGASVQKTHLTSTSSVGVEKSGSPSSGTGGFFDAPDRDLPPDVRIRRSSDAAALFPAQIFFAPSAPVPKR